MFKRLLISRVDGKSAAHTNTVGQMLSGRLEDESCRIAAISSDFQRNVH
jgi:hypothetical protein